MQVKEYKKRKAEGKVEFRAMGENAVGAFCHNYDAATGKRMDDTFSQLSVTGLEKDLENLRAQINDMKALEADLVQIIADVKAVLTPAKK